MNVGEVVVHPIPCEPPPGVLDRENGKGLRDHPCFQYTNVPTETLKRLALSLVPDGAGPVGFSCVKAGGGISICEVPSMEALYILPLYQVMPCS